MTAGVAILLTNTLKTLKFHSMTQNAGAQNRCWRPPSPELPLPPRPPLPPGPPVLASKLWMAFIRKYRALSKAKAGFWAG